MADIKSNPIVEQIYEVAPLLNGLMGLTTKIHRYMITLYAAATVPFFYINGKEIENSVYFTLYGLSKIARILNDIRYDRSRVALGVYKKAENMGLVEFKKDRGETYVKITSKGTNLYSKILVDLLTIKRLHSIIPSVVENSIPHDRFISKGGSQIQSKQSIQFVIQSLMSDMNTINSEFGNEILMLEERDTNV